MDTVKKLETTIAGWYKQSPVHLPVEVRKWLGENAWWIVAIGAVVSGLIVLSALRMLYLPSATNSMFGLGEYVAFSNAPLYNPWTDPSLWASMIPFGIILVLELKAINPLKARAKQGWDLIFLTMLIAMASAVISALVSGALYGILGAGLGLAIGGFFLFEVRDQFGVKVHAGVKTTSATKTKK